MLHSFIPFLYKYENNISLWRFVMVTCNKCGGNVVMRYKGSQIGLYCVTCGSWIKWVGKKEKFALLEQGVTLEGESLKVPSNTCPQCGSYNLIKKKSTKGVHTGLYCADCGSWIKWLKKGMI